MNKAYLKKNQREIFYSLTIAFVLFLITYFCMYERSISVKLSKEFITIVGVTLVVIEFLLMWTHWEDVVSFRVRYLNLSKPRHFFFFYYFYILPFPSVVLLGYWSWEHKVLLQVNFILVALAIILILYLFLLITYWVARSRREKSIAENTTAENNESGNSLADEPINDKTEDLLDRGKFVEGLKKHICETSSQKASVFALYGKWGEGKTSVLNLLKKEIAAGDGLLVYEFDPWYFDIGNSLTANFYHGLENLLEEHYVLPKKIKDHLELYVYLLAKKVAKIELPFKKTEAGNRPIELKKKMEEFIGSLDKRILVIIDDIDRLQADQILAVFRLVKLTGHIKNMVFLLSFDWLQVISILGNQNQTGDAVRYLEKIVQYPLHLPSTDQRIVDHFLLFPESEGLLTNVGKLFSRLQIDKSRQEEFYKDFCELYQSKLWPVFSTFRGAKLFINSVSSRLPIVEREVYLYDFFIIELIRVFFPDIYSDIVNYPDFYVVTKGSGSFRDGWRDDVGTLGLSIEPKKRNEQIKEHLDELTNPLNSRNKESKNIIISLLKNIFPVIDDALENNQTSSVDPTVYQKNNRIAVFKCFPKYFLQVSKEDIPDAQ